MTSTGNSVGMSEANAPKPLPLEALERLKELALAAAKRAPGLWGSDIEKSEGEYGIGDETNTGFFVPYMETEHGKRLFDAHYCDVAEVHEDYDEDGVHAWDEAAREIFAFLSAVQPQAILDILSSYEAQGERLREVEGAFGRAVEINAYSAADPLALRLAFENEADRLAAANALAALTQPPAMEKTDA